MIAIRRCPVSSLVVVAAALLSRPVPSEAQVVEAQAYLIGTMLRPTPVKATLRELRLTQPVVMASWRPAGGFATRLTLNAEALTLEDGELTAGSWGEGFVDRRHPHTAVHEVMVTATAGLGGSVRLGLAAGKGFVPFGSDDPMSRPMAAYPVNHHLAQILERAVLVGQIGVGPLTFEGALFNGDEPERPWQWPRLARFGDSWSVRATIEPIRGLELSGSLADVASPEARTGNGPEQHKVHLAARMLRTESFGTLGGLVEWARTSEVGGVFRFHTVLAEGWGRRGNHRVAIRVERSDRPEEERVTPFRAVRPHIDNSLVGITRWTLFTVGYHHRGTAGHLAVEPFVEATVGSVREIAGGIFDVPGIYGGPAVRRVSLGMRIAWRESGHRMGRYGLLDDEHHEVRKP